MTSQAPDSVSLTSGKLLARNTIWNLVGSGAPMIVAAFSIPILIRGLGKERFGVLALAWALIGYASLFDLGLGRALTQLVAKRLGTGEDKEVPALVWTSLALMLLLGFVGTAAIALASPWLVHSALKIAAPLQSETVSAFYLLALSVPLVITTAGLRGLLEAYQRFGMINALRIPTGVYTFASPLLVLPFSQSLVPVVAVLVLGRLIGWVAHLILCLRATPALGQGVQWKRTEVRPLLRFGGWMTISNLVSPLMVTLDRFVIGALVSMTAVAYYATPYEVVTKFLFVPAALMGVMFPAFSMSYAQDRSRAEMLFGRCVKFLFLVLFPVVLLTVSLAHEALRLWLGPDFAEHSFRVLQWLAVGVLLNSLATAPFTLVQGAGRPDLTAKLHLVELPLYLALLWWLIRNWGIEGAAIAWTTRVGLDAMVLFFFSRSLLPHGSKISRITIFMVVAAAAVLWSATLVTTMTGKVLFQAGVLPIFVSAAWFLGLSSDERALMRDHLKPYQALSHGD